MNSSDNFLNEFFNEECLLAVADLLLEDGDLDGLFRLLEDYPEITEFPGSTDNEIDMEFTSTDILFERLKQRLINDGLWKDEVD